MIYLGNSEILGIKLGNDEISGIYVGDTLIYPTTVTAWSVTPTQIEVKRSGGAENIRIASLSAWTIVSSENWITFSQNSGDSGRTTVIATIADYAGDTDRTATITVTDGTNTSTISVTQIAGAVLPAGSIYNFNAKETVVDGNNIYMPNFSGTTQLPWLYKSAAITVYDDHITIPTSGYGAADFASTALNEWNYVSGTPMTIVFKAKRSGGSGSNFISNRNTSTYNYMVRMASNGILSFHTTTTNASTPSATTYNTGNTLIAAVRVSADRQVTINNLTNNTTNTPFTTTFNGGTNWNTFFGSRHRDSSGTIIDEPMTGDFYWVYLSHNYLTDNEIQQVIDYNEDM